MEISNGQQKERKPRPEPDQALRCPRCDSLNTKFCYYNNYSLSQPRYFCKSCRRYWTKGGSLRNVPVGGGCRKNKRPPSSSSSSNSSSKKPILMLHDPAAAASTSLLVPTSAPNIPPLSLQQNSLSAPFMAFSSPFFIGNPNPNGGFLDILRSGFSESSTAPSFNYGLQVDHDGMRIVGYDGVGGRNSTEEDAARASGEGCSSASGHGTLEVDYWNINGAVGSSSWNGIINSSLM